MGGDRGDSVRIGWAVLPAEISNPSCCRRD